MKKPDNSSPKLFLHIEGAAIFLFSTALYFYIGGTWWLFLLLLLSPDIFVLGYLKDNKTGSFIYNLGHIYLWPLALAGLGIITSSILLIHLGLIWSAHIGMDRMIGYGLKYPSGFKITHFNKS